MTIHLKPNFPTPLSLGYEKENLPNLHKKYSIHNLFLSLKFSYPFSKSFILHFNKQKFQHGSEIDFEMWW